MKKIYTLLAVLPLFFTSTQAIGQIYEDEVDQEQSDADYFKAPPIALGFRANPDGAGLNGRYFFNQNIAVEGQVNGSAGNYYDNGTSLTVGALMEYHFLLRDPHWRIFIGGGIHYGKWQRYRDQHLRPINLFGLDAIGGIEYILNSVPIGFSLDVKPAMNFINGVTYLPNNVFGLGVRYYFGGGSKKKDKTVIVTQDHSAEAPLAPAPTSADSMDKDGKD